MNFCDSFIISNQEEKINLKNKIGFSFWPINSNPIKSSIKSLNLNQLKNLTELKELSLVVLFTYIYYENENEELDFELSKDDFLNFFEGFTTPINLENNKGFIYILNGKESNEITRSRAISFLKVLNSRNIFGNKLIKCNNIFEIFPNLSKFSIRFPIDHIPFQNPTFIPFKNEIKIFNKFNNNFKEIKWEKTDKIEIWRNHLSEIIPNIFISSKTIAENFNLLKKNGITSIINLASQVCESSKGFNQLNIPMQDGGDDNLLSYIWDTTLMIDETLNNNGKILIHCLEGVSRSVSICIAYLILKFNYDYFKAFNLIRSKRRVASPHPKFIAQLIQLSEILGLTEKYSCNFIKDKQIIFQIINKKNQIIPLPLYKKINLNDENGVFIKINFENSLNLLFKNNNINNNLEIICSKNYLIEHFNFAKNISNIFLNYLNLNQNINLINFKNNENSKIKYFESPSYEEIFDFDQNNLINGLIYISNENNNFKMFITDNVDENCDYNNEMEKCCKINNFEIPEEFPIIFSNLEEEENLLIE